MCSVILLPYSSNTIHCISIHNPIHSNCHPIHWPNHSLNQPLLNLPIPPLIDLFTLYVYFSVSTIALHCWDSSLYFGNAKYCHIFDSCLPYCTNISIISFIVLHSTIWLSLETMWSLSHDPRVYLQCDSIPWFVLLPLHLFSSYSDSVRVLLACSIDYEGF